MLTLIMQLRECLLKCPLEGDYARKAWRIHVVNQLDALVKEALHCHILGAYRCLKFILEIAFQSVYLKEKYGDRLDSDEAFRDLQRRSKKAMSFSVRMITDMKGLPGPYKRKFLRAYLRLGEYTHPSFNVLQDESVSEFKETKDERCLERVRADIAETLDILIYVFARYWNRGCLMPLLKTCESLGMELCLKALKR